MAHGGGARKLRAACHSNVKDGRGKRKTARTGRAANPGILLPPRPYSGGGGGSSGGASSGTAGGSVYASVPDGSQRLGVVHASPAATRCRRSGRWSAASLPRLPPTRGATKRPTPPAAHRPVSRYGDAGWYPMRHGSRPGQGRGAGRPQGHSTGQHSRARIPPPPLFEPAIRRPQP
ncbi:uncharacterized protein LOC124593991 [Schistocerca americana]|uniref:uncharacterized protein LOC124593991 n=1 Tax=Schistocerca americana TaxID=7009 RepID=UPI001F502776|nr:uncharacterized protein LOC124593991 [Schistocerca americana]